MDYLGPAIASSKITSLNIADNYLYKNGGIEAVVDMLNKGTNEALTSLNLANNELGAEGAKHVAEAIKEHVSALQFFWYHFELDLTSGSTAVVYGYSYYNTTKGALASLDLSQNRIPAKLMGPIQRLCESKQIALRK